MSFLSFFPLIPATTTASAAPVYHGGMIPCLGDVEPVNTQWLVKGYFPMGAVSVLAGPGGVGKGVFMADVTAAVTTGRPTTLFPDAAGRSDCSERNVYSTGRGRFVAPGGTDSDPGDGQRAEADTHHGAGEGEL